MLPEYKTKTNVGIGLGIILQLSASLFAKGTPLGSLMMMIGLPLTIYGCCCYAKGKGHHWAWGFLGLLNILGLLVLVFFPDRNKV